MLHAQTNHITNHKAQAGNRLHLVLGHEMPRKCLKEQRPNRRAHECEEPKESPHRRMAMGVVSGNTQRIATRAWFQEIPEPGHSTENHRKNQLSKEFKLC